jgi:hypothetical protein
MKILLVSTIAAGIFYLIYKKFVSVSDKVETTNSDSNTVHPTVPAEKEPDYIYLYAGDIINREGKTFKWDANLKKYIQIK